MSAVTPAVFISYRRSDADGHARLLCRELSRWFDAGALFFDQGSLDAGDAFPAEIDRALRSAAVILVIIGPGWLAEINRRAGEPAVDFVRREVETALARQAAGSPMVIPVLVGNAAMPAEDGFHDVLRPALAPLCGLDAHVLGGKQAVWDHQFVLLRDRVAGIAGVPAARFRNPPGVDQVFRVIDRDLAHFRDPEGRLGQLRARLDEKGTAAVLGRAALYGMGGIGKTQLALRYSQDFRDRYAGVWWFRADGDTGLQLDADQLCREASVPVGEGEAPAAALKRWLERQAEPWLLVYDNAEEVAALRVFLPQAGGHHVIVTSRNPAWGGVAAPLELETWTADQGADFFATRLPAEARDALKGLSQDLGGLPLALEQAASYLESTGMAVAEYRSLLADEKTALRLLASGEAASGYEATVAATLAIAMPRLSPAAAQLLGLCAFAAPEPLAERFVREAADLLPGALAAAAADDLVWNACAGELRRYGLAQRVRVPALDARLHTESDATESALLLHRLTQQVARSRSTAPAADAWGLQAVIRYAFPEQTRRPDRWRRCAALAEHVIHLDRFTHDVSLEMRPHTWLLDRLATYLAAGPALFDDAVRWHKRAVEINRRVRGEEHPATLASMGNLGSTLKNKGDLAGARALQEKVLDAHWRVFGEEHPDTLTSMNNLAGTLLDQGGLAGARALQEKVLDACRRVLGEEHPATLTSMNNLAGTLWKQGDLANARALQGNVLDARRRVLGAEHPDTLNSMNNLAGALWSQGDLAGARALQEKVLDACRRVLGEEHPRTLTSMNNLAGTLRSQGDLAGARALQEEVLDACRRVLGEEHPGTLTSMNNLAGTLWSQGDLAGARALQEKALDACRRVLGEEHPDTLGSMNNLAGTLRSQGDLAGARALQEKVLDACRRVLGEEYPDTLTTMDNLASTLRGQGDLAGARALQEKVFAARRRVLGEEHQDTLTSMGNLAELDWEAGKQSDAMRMMDKAASIAAQFLEADNPVAKGLGEAAKQMRAALDAPMNDPTDCRTLGGANP